LPPYFFEDIRNISKPRYGTEAVHERGLRVYTTLNLNMQRIANQSLRDGLPRLRAPPRMEGQSAECDPRQSWEARHL